MDKIEFLDHMSHLLYHAWQSTVEWLWMYAWLFQTNLCPCPSLSLPLPPSHPLPHPLTTNKRTWLVHCTWNRMKRFNLLRYKVKWSCLHTTMTHNHALQKEIKFDSSLLFQFYSGHVVRVSALKLGGQGSIPGRVTPKTLKRDPVPPCSALRGWTY